MVSLSGFNANEVEPNEGFDVLPEGKYQVIIIDSERRTTNDGKSDYLWFELEVVSESGKGRKIWDRLYIWHDSSEKSREIAKGTLSSICRAVGVLTPNDTMDLHNRPMEVSLKIRKQEGYGPQNVVSRYAPVKRESNGQQEEKPWGGSETAKSDSIPF